jgi:hypothetical protein
MQIVGILHVSSMFSSPLRALPLHHAVEPPPRPVAVAPRPATDDEREADWETVRREETTHVKAGLLPRAVALAGALEAGAAVVPLWGGKQRRIGSTGTATRLGLAATLLVAARERSWRAPLLSVMLLSRAFETAAAGPGDRGGPRRLAAPLELAVLTGLWREAVRAERWERT